MPRRLDVVRLRHGPEALLAALHEEDGPVLVVDGDELVAVLLSPDGYRRRERERELLRRLALGELEAAAGEGHDLDEVLEECELLLDEQ